MADEREFVDREVSGRDLDAINQRITRQIDTQERERRETAEHLRDLIDRDVGVPLREYVEAVMDESKRALEMAEREREKAAVALREQTQKALDKADVEREKAASALRTESQRALDKADVEREKSASVLRADLAESIQQGDTNLRNHIHQEIERIREALASGEKLELSRIQQVEELARSVQRELLLVQSAAKEAIGKAETSTDKRFESVNELRGQMNDLILSHQTSVNSLTEKLMLKEVAERQFEDLRGKLDELKDDRNAKLPREVFDRTVAEWTTWRAMIDRRLAAEAARDTATTEHKSATATETQLSIARGALVVAAIGLIVTVVLAANGVF